MELFPIKYRLTLCKKTEAGNYTRIRTVKIGRPKDIYYIRDKQYTFEPSDVSLIQGRTYTQFKDIDTGQTVLSHKVESTIDPDAIQQRNKEKLAKKATETTGTDYGIVTIIAIGIGALCAGLFIMTLLYPTIFPNMMKEVPKTAQVILSVVH